MKFQPLRGSLTRTYYNAVGADVAELELARLEAAAQASRDARGAAFANAFAENWGFNFSTATDDVPRRNFWGCLLIDLDRRYAELSPAEKASLGLGKDPSLSAFLSSGLHLLDSDTRARRALVRALPGGEVERINKKVWVLHGVKNVLAIDAAAITALENIFEKYRRFPPEYLVKNWRVGKEDVYRNFKSLALQQIEGKSRPFDAETRRAAEAGIRGDFDVQKYYVLARKVWRASQREREELLRAVGVIGHGSWAVKNCSNTAVADQEEAEAAYFKYASERWLVEKGEAANPDASPVNLADCVKHNLKSVTAKRYAVFMGMSDAARALGYTAFFATLTLPGRFHSWSKKEVEAIWRGRKAWREEEWNYSTVREAAAELQRRWQRVRAILQKEHVRIFGFTADEPHSNGTPHKHAPLLVHPDDIEILKAALRRHFPEIRLEDGALKEANISTPAQARKFAGYCLNYLQSGHDEEDEADDETKKATKKCGKRNKAWAVTHGVHRRFAWLGLARNAAGIWDVMYKVGRERGAVENADARRGSAEFINLVDAPDTVLASIAKAQARSGLEDAADDALEHLKILGPVDFVFDMNLVAPADQNDFSANLHVPETLVEAMNALDAGDARRAADLAGDPHAPGDIAVADAIRRLVEPSLKAYCKEHGIAPRASVIRQLVETLALAQGAPERLSSAIDAVASVTQNFAQEKEIAASARAAALETNDDKKAASLAGAQAVAVWKANAGISGWGDVMAQLDLLVAARSGDGSPILVEDAVVSRTDGLSVFIASTNKKKWEKWKFTPESAAAEKLAVKKGSDFNVVSLTKTGSSNSRPAGACVALRAPVGGGERPESPTGLPWEGVWRQDQSETGQIEWADAAD